MLTQTFMTILQAERGVVNHKHITDRPRVVIRVPAVLAAPRPKIPVKSVKPDINSPTNEVEPDLQKPN